MKRNVFIVADNIISPVASTTAGNFAQLKQGKSGVKEQAAGVLSDKAFFAALLQGEHFFAEQEDKHEYSKFEKLLIASIADAMQQTGVDPQDKKTLLIISSTKGNISLLETNEMLKTLEKRIALHTSAAFVAAHFNFINTPMVVSNACISGSLAIITGMRLIQSGEYDTIVVAGADVISKFVLSGFQSFQAISAGACKPFDKARDGINLGEGAGTVILSYNNDQPVGIKVCSGAVSNDANHISGPSRTGQELGFAISKTLEDAGVATAAIDFISAHGTATVYNDEMEANAFTLAGLEQVPVNSLKGYFGHTLGAAGIIETIISSHSLKEDIVLPTLGCTNPGATKPINVCTVLYNTAMKHCLKTASGFGGCNAALLLGKA